MSRVAVVGVGAMGQNHARVYHEIPNVTLVGVTDAVPATAARIAQLYNTTAYPDLTSLLAEAKPDAITVAVPTQEHYQTVEQALRAGVHVLVEKPIAATVEQATALIALAESLNLVLMVGHIERFNPAVIELKKQLSAGALGRMFQIHTRRLGPFPARVRDVGVVVDLATHDLDLMRFLAESDVTRVFAETERHIHTSNEDLFGGLVRFNSGVLGILEINWLTPSKIRELYITGERGMFLVNFLTQDLFFYANGDAESNIGWPQLSVLRGVTEGQMTRFALTRREPLRAEQEAFLASVRGEPHHGATGADGMEALRLALACIASGQAHEQQSM